MLCGERRDLVHREGIDGDDALHSRARLCQPGEFAFVDDAARMGLVGIAEPGVAHLPLDRGVGDDQPERLLEFPCRMLLAAFAEIEIGRQTVALLRRFQQDRRDGVGQIVGRCAVGNARGKGEDADQSGSPAGREIGEHAVEGRSIRSSPWIMT